MAPTNDFLPFCETDTGTNLLSQGDYSVDAQRSIGNQPGIARSKLANKALRQATYIASQVAQFLANRTGNDVLDDATPSEIQTTMLAALKKPPTIQKFLTGSGTYTTPAHCLYLKVTLVGGGGGGAGSGVSSDGGIGGDGGNTTFGTTLLSAGGGQGGQAQDGGSGGTASLGSGPIGIALSGGVGGGQSIQQGLTLFENYAPNGAASPLGGEGGGGSVNKPGTAAAVNSGSGGGGGGMQNGVGATNGTSGGAGGYVSALIATPLTTYAYSVGAAGTAGPTGTAPAGLVTPGGAGGSGLILVEEFY